MASLRGLEVFSRVVEAGSFSAAARGLGLSKSAVSKQVAGLEDRLGARFLNRTTRRLSLTEVGAAFHLRAVRILAEVEEAELAVTRLHANPRGILRINAPMSFGHLHVAPAMAEFMARYPDLRVELILNDRIVDLVEEGFDATIRIQRMPDTSLVARKLALIRLVICAVPEYWQAHGRPRVPDDIEGHNCLIYTYQQAPDQWRFRGPDGLLTKKIGGTFHANNGEALRSAALAGLGVYLGPTFMVGEDLRTGRMEAVLQEYEETDLAVYAVYPQNRHLSAKVRAFVDFMAERYGPEPYWDAE